MSSFTTLRTAVRARAGASLATNNTSRLAARQIHRSAALRAYKDDQDRESLKPKAHEYTQSGTDDEVASMNDAAFNPDKTAPETERAAAGAGGDSNPLNESPASKSFSEAGRDHVNDKTHHGHGGQKKASGSSSAPKNSKTG
ncbi:hypothetical protein F4821DRAFT_262719 [Hypoxylon rubiginosum]|uniref:Uncharacterized protein n=1 Tax=Hypoxylon rubiginosum TaxID=110542 RepID=A0ACC0CTA4_9PEZI|nr:hypothetical protein F4821DRAFT_262719 [Hypoxylon rubiginosum]